jgi:stage V sporulation protein B
MRGARDHPPVPESFLRGALILAASGLVVKLLGAFYRIPFSRMVGSEGVGLYQMAYPIYITLIALSTSGVPIAISMLVAERGARGDRFGARQVFLVALVLMFLFGLLLSVGLYHSAPYLAEHVLDDARAYYSLVSIAPAILVISVTSAFRGYFQGWQLMWPTALSELVEQCLRVVTVFWAAYMLLARGVEFAAAGAAFGAFTGGCGSLLVLCCVLLWFERGIGGRLHPGRWGRVALSLLSGAGQLLQRMLAYALPVSACSMVLPMVQTIDAIIIPNRLQAAGFSFHQATAMFGELSGMAGTLVYLPAIFTVSLAASLVPNIAAALARNRSREINERAAIAVRISILFCLPSAIGLAVLGTPLSTLLFADPQAGPVTSWLAPSALFSGLQQTTSGILQGMGCTWLPVVNLLAGCAVKTLCNYYLTVVPGVNVKGAALGSVAGLFAASLLNYWSLRLLTGYRGPAFFLPRPLLAATIMGAAVWGLYRCLLPYGNPAATLIAMLGGMVCYFAVLLLTGELSAFGIHRLFRR